LEDESASDEGTASDGDTASSEYSTEDDPAEDHDEAEHETHCSDNSESSVEWAVSYSGESREELSQQRRKDSLLGGLLG